MLRSYAIDQTKQDNPALGRPPPADPKPYPFFGPKTGGRGRISQLKRAQEWFSGTKMRAQKWARFLSLR